MDFLALVRGLLKVYKDQAELAQEVGVTQPTVSRWLAGAKPELESRDKVVSLAKSHGLVVESVVTSRKIGAARDLDRVDEIDVTAGLGGGGLAVLEQTSDHHGMTFAAEVVRDFWRLPQWVLNRFNAQATHIKAFPAQGDSMEPTIEDGDVVFADTRHRVPSPPGVYVLADEFGGVVVKRLEVVSRPREDPVMVRIISDNPRHAPKEFTLEEISIIGRYIGRFTT